MTKLFGRKIVFLFIYLFAFVSGRMRDAVGQKLNNKEQCPKVCQCHNDVNIWMKITCSGQNLKDVPQRLNFFTKSLDLSCNNMSEVRKRSYTRLHFVENLDLGNNVIETMELYSFKDLQKLKILRLHGNKLKSIPEKTFMYNPNIKRLHLSANFLQTIGNNSLVGLRNLEELHLDKNLIKNIPSFALQKTSSLTFLNLAVNQITAIENDAFINLPNLQVLILRDNLISRIGENGFRGIFNCVMLKLDSNKLTKYPQTAKQLRSMIELTFSDNEIKELPDRAFENQVQLRTLDFSNNPLNMVGVNTFTNLPFLESIFIENVTHQDIFPDFSGCISVKELSVTGGNIIDLPMDLCTKLPLLHSLDVSNNDLLNVSAIMRCGNLTKLDASGNELMEAKESEFRNAKKLTELNLSGNKIKSLDENVFGNLQLTKLNLAQNQFSFLPVVGLRRLKALNLSGVNTLLYLPPAQLFTSLRIIDAAYSYHCCQFLTEWTELHKTIWDDLPKNYEPVSCYPEPGPLSPCVDLLPSMTVRVVLWIVLIVSVVVNIAIITVNVIRGCIRVCKSYARKSKQANTVTTASSAVGNERKTLTTVLASPTPSSNSNSGRGDAFELALCHLALSDVIASVYVAIILAYDTATRNNFAESGAWWEKSIPCRTAGVFLVMGLQLSFFTVIIATVERYIITMYPLKPEKHVGKTVVGLSLSAAWVISVATAIVTLYSSEDYKDFNPFGAPSSANGATCLPWSTEFPYVAVLVGCHVVLCLVVSVLCFLMFCARRKRSWLSAQKHTRRQIAFTVACNVLLILPLALVGLLASALASYPTASEPWLTDGNTDYFSYETAQINVDLLLTFVILLISLRFVFNPFVYVVFGDRFRDDILHVTKAVCCAKRRSRYHDYECSDDENGFSEGTATEFTFQEGSVRERGIPLEEYEYPQFEEKLPMNLKYIDTCQHSSYSHNDPRLMHNCNHTYHDMYNGENKLVYSPNRNKTEPEIFPEDIPSSSKWPDGYIGPSARPQYQTTNHLGLYDHDETESEFEIIPQQSSHVLEMSGNNHIQPKYRKVFNKPATNLLPPWTLHGAAQTLQPCSEAKKLSQSCESSTSKDSGIQSEHDYGVCTACSSDSNCVKQAGQHSNQPINYGSNRRPMKTMLYQNSTYDPKRSRKVFASKNPHESSL